jgi:hypothetical protein
MKTTTERIKERVEELVMDLLYYDGKTDPTLLKGTIVAAITAGDLSSLDIVKWFSDKLFLELLQHSDNVQ